MWFRSLTKRPFRLSHQKKRRCRFEATNLVQSRLYYLTIPYLMPLKADRPGSHQLSDLAEAQVEELFHANGWIVDPTITDYGEDLVVQMVKNDFVTPNRFYVQCKGTKHLDALLRKGF